MQSKERFGVSSGKPEAASEILNSGNGKVEGGENIPDKEVTSEKFGGVLRYYSRPVFNEFPHQTEYIPAGSERVLRLTQDGLQSDLPLSRFPRVEASIDELVRTDPRFERIGIEVLIEYDDDGNNENVGPDVVVGTVSDEELTELEKQLAIKEMVNAAREKETLVLAPLSHNEVRDRLKSDMEKLRNLQREQLGKIPIFFPAGTRIGEIDVSGMTLEGIIEQQLRMLETYEPKSPRTEASETIASHENETPSPEWLRGKESLIWHGAHDNPLWEPVATQYGDTVRITYMRREEPLRPGKSAREQSRSLEITKDTFTATEWRVLKVVLAEYINLEKIMASQNTLRDRQEAREKILRILQEENKYRKGVLADEKGQQKVPEIIATQVYAAISEVAKTTRGFKPDSISRDTLAQSAAELLSQLLVLNRTRGDGRDHVPSPKRMAGITEYPSFSYTLSELTDRLALQQKRGQGITLAIGEAGTGKNVAGEYVAYQTNRPFFWFPCGRGMEAMDLVNHYEFDSAEGTKRFLTDLAQGLQTPGALVFIDEVNALKPEVQATLHGLGDANRTLKYDGVTIPVAEDVLIMIATNPASYGSAGNLGEALLNRTRGLSMTVDYPALRKGEILARKEGWNATTLQQREQQDNTLREYAADEVLMLFSALPEFSSVSKASFEILWDAIVNEHSDKIPTAEQDGSLAPLFGDRTTLNKTLLDLKNVLEIGDRWRKNYGKRAAGFDIVGFSSRDALAVVHTYAQTRDVRAAFLKVYDDFRKNPIDGLDVQYEAIKREMTNVLQQNGL